ncbi:MAG: M50 family metallopeptidase [Patescibacteria group bacterium]|nr:M50 family metallopeptidase [Patescibacteria group bacterium]
MWPVRLLLQVVFCLIAYAALTDSRSSPMQVASVLFHESAHGVAAIATGGAWQKMEISADDLSGACQTNGGFWPLIAVSGYLGVAVVGVLAIFSSRRRKFAVLLAGTLTIGSALAHLLQLNADAAAVTWRMAFCCGGLMFLCGVAWWLAAPIMRMLGTFMCFYAFFDTYGDCFKAGNSQQDDFINLGAYLGLDRETVGVVLLIVIAAISLHAMYRSVRGDTPVPPRFFNFPPQYPAASEARVDCAREINPVPNSQNKRCCMDMSRRR